MVLPDDAVSTCLGGFKVGRGVPLGFVAIEEHLAGSHCGCRGERRSVCICRREDRSEPHHRGRGTLSSCLPAFCVCACVLV